MTHDVIRHLLDDYVTGELPNDARAPVAEHVAVCAICADEVQALQRVLARAADLPKSIEPPAEAWENIKAAIQRDEASIAPARHERFEARHPLLLALAASIIVAILSSVGTAAYLKSRASSSTSVASITDSGTPTNFAAFTIEENNYLRTVGVLQDVLDQQESALAPETVAQLRASLRTIDEAILEARNALARDPANKVLIDMLSASYRQKVDLLRRTTEMTRGT
ncbi:MAG TPA: zf-HC2 domain-containing protein [Gemmatimonadaceae bacterium]|jgi:anti-sigma-K factor RskA|nr:zf-HC2 domain-containing protein [Gemmatimonadaceae bacterium]